MISLVGGEFLVTPLLKAGNLRETQKGTRHHVKYSDCPKETTVSAIQIEWGKQRQIKALHAT